MCVRLKDMLGDSAKRQLAFGFVAVQDCGVAVEDFSQPRRSRSTYAGNEYQWMMESFLTDTNSWLENDLSGRALRTKVKKHTSLSAFEQSITCPTTIAVKLKLSFVAPRVIALHAAGCNG